MSEISRTSENNRLAYSNDTNRLGVSDNNTQTNDTSATGGVSRKDYLENYITKKQKQIENGDIHDGSLAQQQEWVQSAIQMLHTEFPETSDWPGADPELVGFQASVRPTSTNHSETQKYFEYRSGAKTRVVVDRGDPNDVRPTTAQFWTTDNGICLPDNASDVSYSYDKSDPKDPKITVQIHFPDGATKTMVYHNVDRPGFKLKIDAANPDAVKLNLSQLGDVAKKVTVTQYKEATDDPAGGDRAGDKPTGTEDGADLYDTRKDVNIFPVADGSDHRTIVRSGGTVTITANSNSECFKVKYDDKSSKYIIEVYANDQDKIDGNVKETIEIDGKLLKKPPQIDADPSRIEIDGSVPVGKKPTIISNGSTNGGTSLVNGDTAVSSFRNENGEKIATYNYPIGLPDGKDIEIHANPDDDVSTHEVNANGTIKIGPTAPASSTDPVEISYDPATKKFTITVNTPGKKPEKFIVDSTQVQHLLLDFKNVKGLATLPPEMQDIIQLGTEVQPPKPNTAPAWLTSLNGQGHPGRFPNEAHSEQAYDFTLKLEDAFKSGDFNDVNSWIDGFKDNGANDVIRGVVSAIWKTANGDKNTFNRLMKQIPPETRQKMIDAVLREKGEWGEKNGDQVGTSEEVANMIRATLE